MTKRIFVAVDIPEDIQNKVVEVQRMLPEFKGKLTEKHNLHLTLKFIGEQDTQMINKIKEQLKIVNFQEIIAKIDEIGVFSQDYIRIVWLRVKNCDELQQKIDMSLSSHFKKEYRFMGHLTIARVKKVYDKNLFLNKLRQIEFSEIIFSVDNFRLKESVLTHEGPVYKTIAEYKSCKI